MIGETLFWIGIGALGYAYLGYPALLAAFWLLRYRPKTGTLSPALSMIVAAHNEAEVIGAKIENFLGLGCPNRCELIVVSDASSDGTDEIVSAFHAPRVALLRQERQGGKSAALNRGVEAATGEILVFSDANSIFGRDALMRLAEPFADPGVGAVSGVLQYEAGSDSGEGLYWRYEQCVKALESRTGRLLGANGAIYAIRRELYPQLHPLDVNDFRVPYEALLRGFRVVLAPEATASEQAAPTVKGEMARKVRIMSRAIPMFLSLLPRTMVAGRPLVAWQLLSHKILREMQALFFLAMLVGAVWATAVGSPLGYCLLGVQAIAYGIGVAGWTIPRLRSILPIQAAAYVTMIAVASALGLARWLSGRNQATWRRTERNQDAELGPLK